MNHQDPNSSSPPISTIVSIGSSAASIADAHKPVILTGAAFHQIGCRWLRLAKNPTQSALWQTYYLMLFPCQTCWPSRFISRWQQALRHRHRQCSPQSSLDSRPVRVSRRTVGRPRSLSESDLERVLSLSKAGLGSRAITTELRRLKIDVSRPTDQPSPTSTPW